VESLIRECPGLAGLPELETETHHLQQGGSMSSSTQQPVQTLPTLPAQPFRLDVPLHDLLQKPPDHPTLARAGREPQPSLTLPSPVFPQHPALIHELDAADIAAHETVLQTGSGIGLRPRL
jgi:hypothetical protein